MKRPKPKQRTSPLTKTQAIARTLKIVKFVEDNTMTALQAETAFQSANDLLATMPNSPRYVGAHCFNTIQHSLALNLALILSRLFDASNHKKKIVKSDRASIHTLAHMLRQKRCRDYFVAQALEWTPNVPMLVNAQARACDKAITNALAVYAGLRKTHAGRRALNSLREFRDHLLAHSLIKDGVQPLPRYEDLHLLMDAARDFTKHACLAVKGLDLDLEDYKRIRRKEADAFWTPALAAHTPGKGAR
jgi:hypothetical protein